MKVFFCLKIGGNPWNWWNNHGDRKSPKDRVVGSLPNGLNGLVLTTETNWEPILQVEKGDEPILQLDEVNNHYFRPSVNWWCWPPPKKNTYPKNKGLNLYSKGVLVLKMARWRDFLGGNKPYSPGSFTAKNPEKMVVGSWKATFLLGFRPGASC